MHWDSSFAVAHSHRHGVLRENDTVLLVLDTLKVTVTYFQTFYSV
jgi:hypothetical protein